MSPARRLAELVTLVDDTLASSPGDPTAAKTEQRTDVGRYAFRSVLGAGGMGEVRLCRDPHIGRDVAVKVMHANADANSELQKRFVREARVQGQLEHPAIVPVYDLGTSETGERYFAMKRVRGVTLAEVVAALAAKEPALVVRFSRHKLLSAYASVCLAVDFAHSHGVVHRDLKPANIMLGDFGEVYVLDWGVARVTGEAESAIDPDGAETSDIARTAWGHLLGTLGYMAPEQLQGQSATADARADIYALGAILFEILTLEPLHRDPERLTPATVAAALTSARERAPDRDVAPELDALCRQATALAPGERPASARELADAIERYLDGDRDLSMRMRLADTHARAAETLARDALAAAGAAEEPRRRALNEVGRALALEPNNRRARATLVTLLTQPPQDLPGAAKAAMDAAAVPTQRAGGRAAAIALAAWLAAIPVFAVIGVRSLTAFWFFVTTHVTAVGLVLWIARSERLGGPLTVAARVVALLAVTSLSALAGPLVLVPGAALGLMMTTSLHPSREVYWGSAWLACLAIALPLALEALGILPASYAFRDGALVILPGMIALPEGTTLVLLFLAHAAVILTAGLIVYRVRRALTRAERAAHLNAWQLQQLVSE